MSEKGHQATFDFSEGQNIDLLYRLSILPLKAAHSSLNAVRIAPKGGAVSSFKYSPRTGTHTLKK
jgi:hypothetical protein